MGVPETNKALFVGAVTVVAKYGGKPAVTVSEKLSYWLAPSVPCVPVPGPLSSTHARYRLPPFVQSREMFALKLVLPLTDSIVFNAGTFVQLLVRPVRL